MVTTKIQNSGDMLAIHRSLAEALPGTSVTVPRAQQITGPAEASPDLPHDWAGA